MTEGFAFTGDPVDTKRKLDKMVQDAQTRMQQFAVVRKQIESATVTAEVGAARATVRSTGGLSGLVLSEQARGMSPSQIANEVLAAVQRAQAGIQGKVQEIVSENDAVDDSAGQAVVDSFTGRYPQPSSPAASYQDPEELRIGHPDDWDSHGSGR